LFFSRKASQITGCNRQQPGFCFYLSFEFDSSMFIRSFTLESTPGGVGGGNECVLAKGSILFQSSRVASAPFSVSNFPKKEEEEQDFCSQ